MLLENKNSVNYGAGDSAVDEQHSGARTVVLHHSQQPTKLGYHLGAPFKQMAARLVL
jgi:hypothetical protein